MKRGEKRQQNVLTYPCHERRNWKRKTYQNLTTTQQHISHQSITLHSVRSMNIYHLFGAHMLQWIFFCRIVNYLQHVFMWVKEMEMDSKFGRREAKKKMEEKIEWNMKSDTKEKEQPCSTRKMKGIITKSIQIQIFIGKRVMFNKMEIHCINIDSDLDTHRKWKKKKKRKKK